MRDFRRAARDGESRRPERPAWPTFRRAVLLLSPHKVLLSGFLAAIALASLVGLVPPLLIRQIIDSAIPNDDGGELNLLAGVMAALIVLGAFNTVLQSWLSNSISQTVMLDLRTRLFRHLSSLSLGWFTANRSGDTLSRVNNDVGSLQFVVSTTLGEVIGNLITLISTFALMLVLDWQLAMFSVVLIPIFVIPARRVGNLQRSLQGQTQTAMAAMTSQMQETLSISGVLLMKTFGRGEDESRRFEDVAAQVRSLSIRRVMAGRWFAMAMGMFGALAPAVVFWYGGHRVLSGDVSLGTVVALAALLPRIFGPAAALLNVHVSVLSSLALFERIFDYLDLEPEIADKPGAIELSDVRGRIAFRDVSFSYVQGQEVLHDVSFDIPAGHFAAFVGPTGAGKTTIAYLIPRLYDVKQGQVLIDGHDVRNVTLESLTSNMAMVNQEPFLFHESIRENLRYASPDATDVEIEAACRAANIHTHIAGLPDGYETVVGARGYRLSGGEKQRVAIARALLKDPAVLILDEATSAVDSVTERAIQDALETLRQGRTVIAIAHRLSTVIGADVVFVIEEGSVVEQGTHAELVAGNQHYTRLYEHQLLTPKTSDR